MVGRANAWAIVLLVVPLCWACDEPFYCDQPLSCEEPDAARDGGDAPRQIPRDAGGMSSHTEGGLTEAVKPLATESVDASGEPFDSASIAPEVGRDAGTDGGAIPASYDSGAVEGTSATSTASECADSGALQCVASCDDQDGSCPAQVNCAEGTDSGCNGCAAGEDISCVANLTALQASPGTLTPAFNSLETTYTIRLPFFATNLALAPEVAEGATLEIQGLAEEPGSQWISPNLVTGENRLQLTVSLPGVESSTYSILAIREDTRSYLKASNVGAGDVFGRNLALSADGKTLAVGAIREASGTATDQDDDNAEAAGAVYVFTRSQDSWSQVAYLKASNTAEGQFFGSSIAISADGSTLVVGAPDESSGATGVAGDQNNTDAPTSGAVYVFAADSGVWSQQAYIKAPNSVAGMSFGYALDVSDDGDTLAVGAPGESSDAKGVGMASEDRLAGSGAVYLFAREAGAWRHQAFIKASNPDAYDEFGCSLALAERGDLLAVGARYEDGDGADPEADDRTNSGAVYVFRRLEGAWTQRRYIKSSDPETEDRFGSTLALSEDGETLAVAATNRDQSLASSPQSKVQRAGAVYIFAGADDEWSNEATLFAPNPGVDDVFGSSVSLSANGSNLAVAARGEDSDLAGATGAGNENARNSGITYTFLRRGVDWLVQGRVKAANAALDDHAGVLALSADGSVLAVGAYGEDGDNDNPNDNSSESSGAAYVYW